MTTWAVYSHIGDLKQLQSGSQIDFVEHMQSSGEPPVQLENGDTFYVEWPNGSRSSGKVVSNTNGIVRIEINGQSFDIRSPVSSDAISEMRSELRIEHWIVV